MDSFYLVVILKLTSCYNFCDEAEDDQNRYRLWTGIVF